MPIIDIVVSGTMAVFHSTDSRTMVIKAITFKPNVGELLECDFGEFLMPPLSPIYDGLIAPEIRKKRLVVVLNSSLPNGCCMVVPISSSGNKNAVERGFHVYLPPALITVTQFYDKRDRWAIADCMTHVSKNRLFPIWNGPKLVKDYLPHEVVKSIQKAGIKAISASALLPPEAPNTKNQVKQATK